MIEIVIGAIAAAGVGGALVYRARKRPKLPKALKKLRVEIVA